MNQPLLVALIAILLFLIWISIDLWKIHDDVSEIRDLLFSQPIAKKPKSSKNVGNNQNNVKEDPK